MLMISTTSITSINNYQKDKVEQELISRIYQQYNPRQLIQSKLKEYEGLERYNKMISEHKEEISKFKNSNWYKLREDTRSFRLPLGLSVDDIIPIQMEVSYYSDLTCENSSYGNVTASGKVLQSGMIANNHLPFGTKVYIEGEGIKTVEDRGSNKYFSTIASSDVFVPRVQGESNSEYYKRVDNLGRKTVQAYVLK